MTMFVFKVMFMAVHERHQTEKQYVTNYSNDEQYVRSIFKLFQLSGPIWISWLMDIL